MKWVYWQWQVQTFLSCKRAEPSFLWYVIPISSDWTPGPFALGIGGHALLPRQSLLVSVPRYMPAMYLSVLQSDLALFISSFKNCVCVHFTLINYLCLSPLIKNVLFESDIDADAQLYSNVQKGWRGLKQTKQSYIANIRNKWAKLENMLFGDILEFVVLSTALSGKVGSESRRRMTSEFLKSIFGYVTSLTINGL